LVVVLPVHDLIGWFHCFALHRSIFSNQQYFSYLSHNIESQKIQLATKQAIGAHFKENRTPLPLRSILCGYQ